MAIYHCSMSIIGRSSGRSAVACAAYRAGDKLMDEELQEVKDYTRKGGIVYSEIMLPENAPREYADRETLWNAVQKVEKAANAQMAREVEVALPRELPLEQQIILLRLYIQACFVSRGMIADFSIHDKGDGNPHAHIMLTMRGFDEMGNWNMKEKKVYALDDNGQKIPEIDENTGEQKVRVRKRNGHETREKVWKRVTVQGNDWNEHGNAEIWRAAWADHCNQFLTPENHIDHRSYARQGIEQIPSIHEGYVARKMETQGETADRCEYNRQVQAANQEIAELRGELANIQEEIDRLQTALDEWEKRERSAAAEQAKAKEIEGLRVELQRLRNQERSLLADYQMAQTVLVDEDSGDFVKEKVAEANRNTLEMKYQQPVTPDFVVRLANAIRNIQARIREVIDKLRKLAGNVGDDGSWSGRGTKARQNQQGKDTYVDR